MKRKSGILVICLFLLNLLINLPTSSSAATRFFYDTFSSMNNWSVYDSDSASGRDYWGIVNEGFYAPSAWCAQNSDGGAVLWESYDNNMSAYMRRTFNFSDYQNTYLEFDYYLATESGYDWLEVYVGGDRLWRNTGFHNWDGADPVHIDLSAYDGQTVTLEFRFVSDNSINSVSYDADGAWVDNVALFGNEAVDPNLVISETALSDTLVFPGDSLRVDATVTNVTPGSTAGSSRLAYYFSKDTNPTSSDYLYDEGVNALDYNEGDPENHTFPIPLEALDDLGTWYVIFEANATRSVTESDYSDNIIARSITVTKPTLENYDVDKSYVATGQSFTIEYYIHNPDNESRTIGLGASICETGTDNCHNDHDNDTQVTVPPGYHWLERTFKVDDIDLGQYDVWWGIHNKTPTQEGDPNPSIGFDFYRSTSPVITVFKPTITDARLDTRTAKPGDTITFEYQINNPSNGIMTVGLGASIIAPGQSDGINDENNDREVTIPSGLSWQERSFYIPINAIEGVYDVDWGIHSKTPDTTSSLGYDYYLEQNYLTIQENPNYSVSGIVRSRHWPYDPICGVTIEIDGLDPVTTSCHWETTGEYTINDVPEGAHTITASHTSYDSGSYNPDISVSNNLTKNFNDFSGKPVPEVSITTDDDDDAVAPGQTINVTVSIKNINYVASDTDIYLDLSFDDEFVTVGDPLAVAESENFWDYPVTRITPEDNDIVSISTGGTKVAEEYLMSAHSRLNFQNYQQHPDEVHSFTVPITVKSDVYSGGVIELKYRGTIGDRRDPVADQSGTPRDQQNWNVHQLNLNIVKPDQFLIHSVQFYDSEGNQILDSNGIPIRQVSACDVVQVKAMVSNDGPETPIVVSLNLDDADHTNGILYDSHMVSPSQDDFVDAIAYGSSFVEFPQWQIPCDAGGVIEYNIGVHSANYEGWYSGTGWVEAFILSGELVIPPEWGSSSPLSPAEGYDLKGDIYELHQFENGGHKLVFKRDGIDLELVLDPNVIKLVILHHTYLSGNDEWDYNISNANQEISIWDEHEHDWKNFTFEEDPEEYAKLIKKKTTTKIVLYGTVMVAGIGAALTAPATLGGSLIIFGGVLSGVYGAFSILDTATDFYEDALARDEYTIIEREFMFQAQKYMDGKSFDTDERAGLYNSIGADDIALALKKVKVIKEGTAGAVQSIGSFAHAASSILNIAAVVLVDKTSHYIDWKTDQEKNDFLYIFALNQHHSMLELLARKIKGAYQIIDDPESYSLDQVLEAYDRLAFYISYYHLNYYELAGNKRYPKLHDQDLKRELRFLATQNDIEIYNQELQSTKKNVEEYNASLLAYQEEKENLYTSIGQSYEELTDINDSYGYIFEIDYEQSNIPSLILGNQHSLMVSINNTGAYVANIVSCTFNLPSGVSLSGETIPSLIEGDSNGPLSFTLDLTSRSQELLTSENNLEMVLSYDYHGKFLNQTISIPIMVEPPIKVRPFTSGASLLRRSATYQFEIKSDASHNGSIEVFFYDLEGNNYFIDNFTVNTGMHSNYLNWTVPANVLNGAYGAKLQISSNDVDYEWEYPMLFSILPESYGGFSNFDQTKTIILSQNEDSEIARRIQEALDVPIHFFYDTDNLELTDYLLNYDLILVGGHEANPLVADLKTAGKLSVDWVKQGDASVESVEGWYGNRAYVVAGYTLMDTAISGLRFIQEIEEAIMSPSIGSISDITIMEGVPLTLPAPAISGEEPIFWSLAEAPTGMQINSTNGEINWSNPILNTSEYEIVVQAENDYGVDTETWNLTVTEFAEAPVILPIADLTIQEGVPYIGSKPVLQNGTSPITWSLVNGPGGMDIDAETGIVEWLNASTTSSPYQITIQAENSEGNDIASWNITVRSSNFRFASGPTGSPNPVKSGGNVQLSATTTDSEGTITYQWYADCSGLPSSGTFNDNALQNPIWTAPVNSGEQIDCEIGVTAQDTINGDISSTYTQMVDGACEYSISPLNTSHNSLAGSGFFNVYAPAGCDWSVSESVSWINILSGSSGTGNGVVNYSVTQNQEMTPRQGTITIADQTFHINQSQKVINGDVDGSGIIDLADILKILQLLSGNEIGEPLLKEADIDGDDKIGLQEAIYILRKMAGLIPDYDNQTMEGVWLFYEIDADRYMGYFVANEAGTLTDHSSFNMGPVPGTYSVQPDGTFSVTFSNTHDDEVTVTGHFTSDSTAAMDDPYTAYSMIKISDLSAGAGTWTGTLVDYTTQEEVSVNIVVDEEGTITRFNDVTSTGGRIGGFYLHEGKAVGYTQQTDMAKPWDQIKIMGAVSGETLSGDYEINNGSPEDGTATLTRDPATKSVYYEVYGAMAGDYDMTHVGRDIIGTSNEGNTFDVADYDRFIIYTPSTSGRIYIDALGLDSAWVDSAPGDEFAHWTWNMIPTGGTWAEHDWYVEGSPDGLSIENQPVGNDAYYSFSTLGASNLTVYTLDGPSPDNLFLEYVPTATITVDGLSDDWAGISPKASDITGDSYCETGTDIADFYLAKDDNYLYWRVDTASGEFSFGSPGDERILVLLFYENDAPGGPYPNGLTVNLSSPTSANVSGRYDNNDWTGLYGGSEYGIADQVAEGKIQLADFDSFNIGFVSAYYWWGPDADPQCDEVIMP